MCLSDDDALILWEKEKRVVEKFVLTKGLSVHSPEFYSLAKCHIESLVGLHEDHPAVIVKSFKTWLSERKV
jgi:hypothetical protein